MEKIQKRLHKFIDSEDFKIFYPAINLHHGGELVFLDESDADLMVRFEDQIYGSKPHITKEAIHRVFRKRKDPISLGVLSQKGDLQAYLLMNKRPGDSFRVLDVNALVAQGNNVDLLQALDTASVLIGKSMGYNSLFIDCLPRDTPHYESLGYELIERVQGGVSYDTLEKKINMIDVIGIATGAIPVPDRDRDYAQLLSQTGLRDGTIQSISPRDQKLLHAIISHNSDLGNYYVQFIGPEQSSAMANLEKRVYGQLYQVIGWDSDRIREQFRKHKNTLAIGVFSKQDHVLRGYSLVNEENDRVVEVNAFAMEPQVKAYGVHKNAYNILRALLTMQGYKSIISFVPNSDVKPFFQMGFKEIKKGVDHKSKVGYTVLKQKLTLSGFIQDLMQQYWSEYQSHSVTA